MALKLTSPAFRDHAKIPSEYTCEGRDPSPELRWSGAPKGTRSFALIMDDPDAPPGTWVHWVIYDIPGERTSLDGGLPKTEALADGAKQGACWGVDRFERVGYFGPCPPPGKAHRYVFSLYALDRKLDLPPRKTKAELLDAMEGHILAQGRLTGLYQR